MTLTGIMAISDNKYIHNIGAVRGSGKTATAVHYAMMNVYEKGHTLYANIHITGLPEGKFFYMQTKDIVKKIVDEELNNVTVLIDEIHLVLNSMGEEKEKIAFYLRLFYQARKLNVDIFYTVIRFMDLHIRFREQTENELIPQKYHFKIENGYIVLTDMCPIDSCKKQHLIQVFCIKPPFREAIAVLNPMEIGKFYNTNEFVRDM